MKPSDFIVESIGADADAMHKDHEVQLARQDCYNAAKNAIELHKLLASVSEQEGLEGWISEKLTLAADYLNTVKEHFEYQQRTATHFMLPEFTFESADAHMNSVLADMCQVCGQTPCNCTHIHESDEFAPSKRAATGVATHNWRRGGERTGSLKGYVVTTFDHIKSVFGDPISGPTDKPYDKVSCEWVITFKDGTTATIYDYKTGKTPMNEYRWHIGGSGKAVEYVTHLLGLEAEDMYEGKQTVSEMTAGGCSAGGFATGPTGGGTFKKTTGVPKKVKNTLRRVSPKIGTGIYK
jgi:hypothetical protein